MPTITNSERQTQSQKNANDYQYYKEHLDNLDGQSFNRMSYSSNATEYQNMRVNYDLIANKINLSDFNYVCKPFGDGLGEMPADMSNKDIITGKYKKVIGMEAKRPFGYTCLAVNEEATTRKEQVHFDLIKDFVMSNIMTPIQQQIELQYQEKLQNKQLSPDERQQIQAQIEMEIAAKTPPEVAEYMARKHQDPAERLSNQLLEYLKQKEKIKDKFLKGFKHAMAVGREIYMVTIQNDEPVLATVNPLYFDYGKTVDSENIQDSDWGVVELHWTASQTISKLRKKLKEEDINRIYKEYNSTTQAASQLSEDRVHDWGNASSDSNSNHLRVLYGAWKSERKVGFLTFYNDKGEEDLMLVGENYVLDESLGDISIEYEWLPETHHGYKICLGNEPIYVGMGAVPGQHRDLNNLQECKLPFIGVDYDDLNSTATSLVDRMKVYQYYYNIIMYRIEALMASDKGKILMMNINGIPKSAKIDIKKWQYFLEANKIAYFNPKEAGNKGMDDVNTMAKTLDMSLASDINQYISLAEYIERRCGDSVGIPKAAEGQASANESVRNNQQNLAQSSDILEPYFQLHNTVKRDVLQALIETAKVAYAKNPQKLTYAIDDMSMGMLDLTGSNLGLLCNSTLGIFVTDSTMAAQAKQVVEQLAHAAMQTSQIDLLDVVKVIRSESIQEAEEKLTVGTERKAKALGEQQQAQQEAVQKEAQAQREWEKEKMDTEHGYKMEEIAAKGELDIQKQTILSIGFNEDKDLDDDGTPDVLEVAKFGVDADVKNRELALKERELTLKDKDNKEKNDIAREANEIQKKKTSVATAKTTA